MSMNWIPAIPPTLEEWTERRNIYDELWLEQIHPSGSRSNQHVGSLKVELERCFCSGAWVARVALSAAIIEVHMSYLDALRGNARDEFISRLNIAKEWEALRGKRNNILHGSGPADDGKRLDASRYRNQQSSLQADAQLAIELALRVVLSNPWLPPSA